MKKLLLSLCSVFLISTSFARGIQFETALAWMYNNGLTMFSSSQEFRPNDKITRGETAKFVSKYAEVIGLSKGNNSCDFNDISNYDGTLVPHIIESCRYGLLKGSQGLFKPLATITEAEAMTLIIRSYEGMQDETTNPWYVNYFTKAKGLGLLNDADTLESVGSTAISRERLGTWFYALGWKLEQGIIRSKIVQTTNTDDAGQNTKNNTKNNPIPTNTIINSKIPTSAPVYGTDLAITKIVPEYETVPYGVKELSFIVTVKNIGSHAVDAQVISANVPPLEIQCQDVYNTTSSMIAGNTELPNIGPGDELDVHMKIYPGYKGLNGDPEDPKPIFQTPGLKTVSCLVLESIGNTPYNTYTYDVYPDNNTKTFTFTVE